MFPPVIWVCHPAKSATFLVNTNALSTSTNPVYRREQPGACYETAKEYELNDNYVAGANIVGFQRVAGAMLAFGII